MNDNKISELKNNFEEKIVKVSNLDDLNNLRVKYLGKKSPLQELSKSMKSLDMNERKKLGIKLNELRSYVSSKINNLKIKLEEKELKIKIEGEKIDVTLPHTRIKSGSSHPITMITAEIEELFTFMGYDVLLGPEIESELYNFEYLNISKDHPARDMQDSFYITKDYLLRTQTSPVQVRTMLKNKDKTPIRMICPGKVYRKDTDDATHTHQFTQIEGLVVDIGISLSDLKGTLELLIRKLFGKKRVIRFRPSYFPFTEPSLEVDIDCFNCNSKGCSICKNSGWIEILGAGMVHPNVLTKSGYDPNKYTGFAFGLGVERVLMLKYGLKDIRDIYNNDLRLLEQFNRIEGGDDNES